MPYYYKDGSAEKFNGEFWMCASLNVGPPIRAGEAITGRAQRRRRQGPGLGLPDRPAPRAQAAQRLLRHADAGLGRRDELRRDRSLGGRLDRFDWKLAGQEGNAHPLQHQQVAQADQDRASWCAGTTLTPITCAGNCTVSGWSRRTLAPGKRHPSPKSRYYVDEDTWTAMLGDRWDAKGQLARPCGNCRC